MPISTWYKPGMKDRDIAELAEAVGGKLGGIYVVLTDIRSELRALRRYAKLQAEADGIEDDDDDDDDKAVRETFDNQKARCALQLIALCSYQATFVQIGKTPTSVIDNVKIHANNLVSRLTQDGDR